MADTMPVTQTGVGIRDRHRLASSLRAVVIFDLMDVNEMEDLPHELSFYTRKFRAALRCPGGCGDCPDAIAVNPTHDSVTIG